MPKISQIDEVPCQAKVRILQKITLSVGALVYSHYREYPHRVEEGRAKERVSNCLQKDGDIPSNLLEGLRYKTENRQNRWIGT